MTTRLALWSLLSLLLPLVGACRSTPAPSPEVAPAPPPDAATPAPDAAAPAPDAATPAPDAAIADPKASEWWRDAVGYEIFVRSFQDSNGDGIGDFNGITQRLDYLASLGVDLVWLMPIHPSPSYHGYDVVDYRDVNPEYGTLADFDALLAAAKQKGIRIIIDFLLNHSSDRHPWFLESRKGGTDRGQPSSAGPSAGDNPKADWYSWKDAAPEGWSRPWDGAPVWHSLGTRFYYGLFWSGMPDLNIANPAVQKEMEDTMAFWVARGVAGFRIDAIRYLIERPDGLNADTLETHAYIRELRARANVRMPGALLLGEAWTNAEDQAAYHGKGDELHLTFSFDMASSIVEVARDGVRSRLNQMLDRARDAFADRGWEAPFLTNHDMPRVAREMASDPRALRTAAALMLASPGTPFLYYGEEIGMVGGAAREDQNKRTPMHWTASASDPKGGFTTGDPWWPMNDEAAGVDVATQSADPGSLLSLYRKLIAARRASPALRRGDQQRVTLADGAKGGKGVITFVRTLDVSPSGAASSGKRVLVAVNVDKADVEPITIELGAPPVAAAASAQPRVLVAENLDAPPTAAHGRLTVDLGARAFAWIALDD